MSYAFDVDVRLAVETIDAVNCLILNESAMELRSLAKPFCAGSDGCGLPPVNLFSRQTEPVFIW